jgi:hypothetical protein
MMKLVTKTMMNQKMNDAIEGKLTVWRTDGPLETMALELSADLTANGERLVVVDAAGCFDPSRVSRAGLSLARNLHVIRAAHSSDLQTALWPALQTAQQKSQARRILIVGMLDHLYGQDMLTRDAARALGRMKLVLEALTRSGLHVVVVCKGEPAIFKTDAHPMGARAYLLSSLCASAHEVHHWPLTAQQYINGASAAIA